MINFWRRVNVLCRNYTPKVGDTLTATVKGAAAASYKWTINGKGAVTTETYTVPADANTGDAIKVVVTAEDGQTAEDTVYVGGFTILKVEPTTDAQNNGYKYIRAYFSSALTSLAPEDIELRSKDTEQLYSIDTVKLSADGTYADITLFGSVQEGGTHFLDSGEMYVMTITNSELFDSYEFELPAYYSNALVTSVDIEKGLVHLEATNTSNQDAQRNLPENYEVGDVYEGNLGTLVGRIVNVGVNSDNELEKISVRDADVVYGVMKFTNGDNAPGTASTKDYFQDAVTKAKYYWTDSETSRINPTVAIKVVDGGAVNLAIADTTYNYAKLVLNPNGTVACAVLDPTAWTDTIRVADVNDTIVTETSKANLDFDGYTIEKDGAYVTTADLEDDDIVYYDSTANVKFAEVYNNVVDGEPSDITATSISIDGVSYKWYDKDSTLNNNAKYYDADDDAFVEFDGADADGNVAAQKILANYDATLGVTAYLDRLGNIAYIDGTDKESAVTTDTWYVTTSAGSGYTQALASYLKFKVSDGTEQTIEIPVAQLKKFNGVDIKKVEGAAGADLAKGTDYTFTFTAKKTTTNEAFGAAIEAQNLIESGVLVKITKDEDGKIIGIAFPDGYKRAAADEYDYATTIDDDNKALKPGVSKVATEAAAKAKLTDDTIIWVYTTKNDGSVSVSKETFADYTRTTEKVRTLNLDEDGALVKMPVIGPFVLIDGSSVSDILLRETLDADEKSDTFAAGDTKDTEGIVLKVTQKKNSAGDANYNSAITLLEIDGSEVTYEALDETALAKATENQYASVKLDKATGKASNVIQWAWSYSSHIDRTPGASSSKALATLDGETIKIDTANQVLKKTATGYEAITMKQIVASTKELAVSWHDQYYNAEDDVHYADFLVVEESTATAAAADAALGAKKAILAANAKYAAMSTPSTADEMSAYEAADATADEKIATYKTLSGKTTVTDTDFGLTTQYTTFGTNAADYAAGKTTISGLTVATALTWTVDPTWTIGGTPSDRALANGTALGTAVVAAYEAANSTTTITCTTSTNVGLDAGTNAFNAYVVAPDEVSVLQGGVNTVTLALSKGGYTKEYSVACTNNATTAVTVTGADVGAGASTNDEAAVFTIANATTGISAGTPADADEATGDDFGYEVTATKATGTGAVTIKSVAGSAANKITVTIDKASVSNGDVVQVTLKNTFTGATGTATITYTS